MINNAQLLSTIKQAEMIKASVATFRTKFNCLPGDCPNATVYFNTDSGGCPGGTVGDGTCNGNGNGFIEYYDYGTVTLNSLDEAYRFWQHLALANLWPGRFTGVKDPGTLGPILGQNVPPTKYPGGIWTVFNSPQPWVIYNLQVNALMIGRVIPAGPWGNLLSPVEASLIDTKIDDGLSLDSGDMYCGETGEWHPSEPVPCVISYLTGLYNKTQTDQICACVIKLKQ